MQGHAARAGDALYILCGLHPVCSIRHSGRLDTSDSAHAPSPHPRHRRLDLDVVLEPGTYRSGQARQVVCLQMGTE
jgi:hypothetical protein